MTLELRNWIMECESKPFMNFCWFLKIEIQSQVMRFHFNCPVDQKCVGVLFYFSDNIHQYHVTQVMRLQLYVFLLPMFIFWINWWEGIGRPVWQTFFFTIIFLMILKLDIQWLMRWLFLGHSVCFKWL